MPSAVTRRTAPVDPDVRTLAHPWRWTAGMPGQDRAAADGYLGTADALIDSTGASDPAFARSCRERPAQHQEWI